MRLGDIMRRRRQKMSLTIETVKTLLDLMTGIPIVEFYADTWEKFKKNGYPLFGEYDYWTNSKDDAIGYLFDKVELYNWHICKIKSQLGGNADKLEIYLTKTEER